MTYAQTIAVNNAALRKADFDHFRAMRRGSDILRDRIRAARGIAPEFVDETAPQRFVRRAYGAPISASPLPPPPPPSGLPVTVTEIIAVIADDMAMTAGDITGRSRQREVADARNLAFYVLVKRGSSTVQVGQWIGGRDHSTVIAGMRRFEERATPYMRKVAEKWLPEGGDA
ncbi:Chromosomal replication initiator, DnaA C-terminal [uncultured Caudovirales phage]|uniref:Chromosomal replication initiator, DnaA C-terminal n=1 Tax=uncultured Caudovirales phage TaxID=2100421 RepID=A0A6J5KFV5_9CAUD|nr:Chromosomal replication initiator, DnaA C-terminal [uncultured Caudovirales phage]